MQQYHNQIPRAMTNCELAYMEGERVEENVCSIIQQ